MSKTWNETRPSRVDRTQQKALDRLRKEDAEEEIIEALTAPQEAPYVQTEVK